MLAESFFTSPLIFKATMGSLALEVTVIDLLIGPTRLVSYFTSMVLDAPGATGPSGFFGIVQPQLDYTSVIIKGASPVFVNSNTRRPSLPLAMVP